MAAIEHPTLFSEVIDFLASTPTLEQIIAFQPSEAIVSRMRDLLDKQGRESLTADEIRELDELGILNHFMSMLKIRARQKLSGA